MIQIGEIFGLIMVIYFGLFWPLSVYKFAKSRTAKGKNLFFEVFVRIGHVSAIIGRIVTQSLIYVFYSYVLNIIMVSIDICPCFCNRRLGALASRKA